VKKFRLKQSIMHRWGNIGDLVVPVQLLQVWAREKDAEECCMAVISYWLDHPPDCYPATWEGLYELLDDGDFGQVADNLMQAVENATIGSNEDEITLDGCEHHFYQCDCGRMFTNINFEHSIAIAKPTPADITVIRWKNERGKEEKFRLKSSIMHKWRDVGILVVPRQLLEVWAKEKNTKECCKAVLSYWLNHPPRNYPATWEGLYELLDDSELRQVAIELKQAVENAIVE
jgi:hypothetical protein